MPDVHPDYETPLEVSTGPMSLDEALADPDKFVSGMAQTQTYCLFVPFTPAIFRAMLGDKVCSIESIEPYVLVGKSGSLVRTTSREQFLTLQERFKPVPVE